MILVEVWYLLFMLDHSHLRSFLNVPSQSPMVYLVSSSDQAIHFLVVIFCPSFTVSSPLCPSPLLCPISNTLHSVGVSFAILSALGSGKSTRVSTPLLPIWYWRPSWCVSFPGWRDSVLVPLYCVVKNEPPRHAAAMRFESAAHTRPFFVKMKRLSNVLLVLFPVLLVGTFEP